MRGDNQAARIGSGPPDEPAEGRRAVVTQKQGPDAGTIRNLAVGASLGWVVLPIMVITDDAARSVSGGDSTIPILWAVIVGAMTGALIGAARLGRTGLVGAAAGALSGALLPYLAVAPVLGLGTTEASAFDHYSALFDHYSPIAIAAFAGAIAGALYAARSARRISLRLGPCLAVGLVVLALWLMSWAFWALALSPRTV